MLLIVQVRILVRFPMVHQVVLQQAVQVIATIIIIVIATVIVIVITIILGLIVVRAVHGLIIIQVILGLIAVQAEIPGQIIAGAVALTVLGVLERITHGQVETIIPEEIIPVILQAGEITRVETITPVEEITLIIPIIRVIN